MIKYDYSTYMALAITQVAHAREWWQLWHFCMAITFVWHISVSTPTTILTTKCKHSETKFHVESCLTATGQYSNLRRLTQVWNCQFRAKWGIPVPKLSRSMDNGTDYSVKTLMDCTLCVFLQVPFPEPFFEINTFLFSCFLSQFHLISCVESQKFLEVRYTACTCSKPRLPCP